MDGTKGHRMILTTAVAFAAVAGAPFSSGPQPTFTANTYEMTAITRNDRTRLTVLGPERFLITHRNPSIPDMMARGNELFVGATPKTRGQRIANRYPTQPDGVNGPDDFGLKLAQFVVTEARAGKLTLTPGFLGGREVLRAEVDLPANRCRDLPAGTATIWLTETTLLPKRLDIERDGNTQRWIYRFAGFNQVFPAHVLDAPALGSRPVRVSNGFLRRSPADASGPLPYVPRLPAVLPNGFRLATSGWAARGPRTGTGNVNRREPNLFSAVYVRGWERIEVTQRVAVNGPWKRDPFSRSCLTLQRGRTTVGTRPARYGIGPEIPSHLWWREGVFLYTVSGPYPKPDLQAIARSLKKI
jgi:hypothetical protein